MGIFRAQWIFILVLAIIASAAAVALSITQPREYEASAELFITTGNELTSAAAQAGVDFTQYEMPSYAILIGSEESAARALKSIGSDDPPADLAQRIKVSFVPQTVMLYISVTDSDPQRAAVLVNAVANQFQDLVSEVDSPDDTFQNLTHVSVVGAADPPRAPLPRHIVRSGMIGLIIGLTLGLGTVSVRRRLAAPSEPLSRLRTQAVTTPDRADSANTSAPPIVVRQG